MQRYGMLVLLLIAVALILGAHGGGSLAVELPEPGVDVRAVQLVGYEVRNPAGQWLGEVTGVLLDPETGEIGYVVLSYREPGVYGRAVIVVNPQRFLAIPWALFTPNPEEGTLCLDADEMILIPAPYVEKAPAFLEAEQVREIDDYWRSVDDERN